MSFSNKVVIVTGASSDIGAATAIRFAKEGANVAIVGRNEVKLNEVASEIKKHCKDALIVIANLTNDEEVEKIIPKTVDKFGKIDVLVNNAAITIYSELQDENFTQAFDKIMHTNLRQIALLTNLAIPFLKITKGNIINVSSVAGETALGNGGLGMVSYATSKAGLNHFSRFCALELAEYGIRVNIVSLGPVKSNMLQAAGYENKLNHITANGTALKEPSEPEEVADVIAVLAKAKTITGANYYIDSGFTVNGNRQDFIKEIKC